MAARDKQKWLTAHALRSGLVEQYAVEVNGQPVVVTLRWVRHLHTFSVSTQVGTKVVERAYYAALTPARERFTRAQNQAHTQRGESR